MVRYLNNKHFEEPSESSDDTGEQPHSRNYINCIPLFAARNKSSGDL